MTSTFESVQPLQSPQHQPLMAVSRSLHWDDVLQTYASQSLIPFKIRNSQSGLMNKLVLWIAPTKPSYSHNFYGNVNFTMEWKKIFAKFGPHLYLMDQSIHNENGYTRILLTNNTYSFLQKVDLSSKDSPIYQEDGQIHHATRIRCKKCVGDHEVQFGIEVGAAGGKWYYENCDVQPINHTQVNVKLRIPYKRRGKTVMYQSYKCFKYNTAMAKECPYKLSSSEIESKMQSECPDILSFDKRQYGTTDTTVASAAAAALPVVTSYCDDDFDLDDILELHYLNLDDIDFDDTPDYNDLIDFDDTPDYNDLIDFDDTPDYDDIIDYNDYDF